MILLLNGAFGIGKTTVARLLVRRQRRAVLFDPEIAGILLQRTARLAGVAVDDFQDLRAWRRLTIVGLRVTRMLYPSVVVPMAFSNAEYLDEIRRGASRFDRDVRHICLVAPEEVVHERLRRRGTDPSNAAWEYRRASECCRAHESETFGQQVEAGVRTPEEIADEILTIIRQ